MTRDNRDYRILDKDLGRLSNADHARLVSGQPVLRLGIALIFVAAVAAFSAGALAQQPVIGMTAAALALALYLALSIGANDVTNSLAPAVGAGAIGIGTGLAMVAVMEIAGAGIAGGGVMRTLTQGLIGDAYATASPTPRMMLAALTAAATCISIATWLNAPVSTTHSIVGAIAGAGVAIFGIKALNLPALATVALGWVVSPILSGCLAALLLASMHRHMLDKDDPIPSGRRWLTGLMGVTAGALALFAGIEWHGASWPAVALLAVVFAVLFAAYTHYELGRQIAQGQGSDKESVGLKRLLGMPLIVTAIIMSFGHGANSAAKVAGPLMIALGGIGPEGQTPLSAFTVLLLAGLGIAMGVMLFGGRLVHMVGSKITQLNPARALCVTLAASLTVLLCTALGLPVSTTHITVGGVFGVGVYREWRDRQKARKRAPMPGPEQERRELVRWSYVQRILGAWVITVPVNAAVAALLVLMIGA